MGYNVTCVISGNALFCSDIDLPMYEILANTSLTWICPQCGFPNVLDSFFINSIASLAFETLLSHYRKIPSQIARRLNSNRDKRRSKVTKCELTCLAANCQRMKNKVADISAIVDKYIPDIVLCNESWLYPDIKNSKILPEEYNIYKKDRISDNHGGVFQAVKKDIKPNRMDINSIREPDSSLCKLDDRLNTNNVIVARTSN